MQHRLILLAMLASACTDDARCIDEDEQPTACEPLEGGPELGALDRAGASGAGAVDAAPIAAAPGPDDLDGFADEATDDTAPEYTALPLAAPAAASTAIDAGPTDHAELRKFLPIGRTAGVTRFVVMRLRPSDLPALAAGDTLRAAAELQVTTRCDIGQIAPGCGYAPHVRMQLLLAGRPDTTDPRGPGVIALSDVKRFDCTKDEHHCVKVIDFSDAKTTLDASAPGCVADDSCFINLVAWAYHGDARSGGRDKLLLGANEGDFLQNGNIEQDRGRIMAIRERDLSRGDVSLRVTGHTVKGAPITLVSNGSAKRIYSHTLKAGHDLEPGEKFRVWADVEASSDHRVNLSLEMFLTKNRFARNGGSLDGTRPGAISEHNGTNCSPGNDCHLRKVAVFEVARHIAGPVYVNIAASTEVPGPGSATTTIHDTGFIKVARYAR